MRSVILRFLLVVWLLLSGSLSIADELMPALNYSATTKTLSARLERAPLDAVLTELNRQTGIAIFIHPSSTDIELNAHFVDLPIHEGIKQLLNGHNYVMIYGPRQVPNPQVVAVHVLKQDFALAEPNTPSLNPRTSTTTRQAQLQVLWSASSSEARIAALHSIAAQDLASLLDQIQTALQDQDAQTRDVLLQRLSADSPASALSLLSEIAASDPDPSVRLHALALLDELGQEAFSKLAQMPPSASQATALALLGEIHGEILANTAATALNDTHPDVRGMAVETLHQQANYRPPPVAAVTAMALHDPQPELRMRALELLVTTYQTDARSLLDQARRDADPIVIRAWALDMSESLKTTDL
ncbi:MAG: HEAT repeat domain-containing protein [Candidatus Competibacteraceae bacterium]